MMGSEYVIDRLMSEIIDYLGYQLADGSFPPGHNGPYNDPETPIRNTAHMLFALSRLYRVTQDEELLVPIERAFKYLISNEYRDQLSGAYVSRLNKDKDLTNGVIGHAWVIEAFVEASHVLGEEAYNEAEKLANIHEFLPQISVWSRVTPEGKKATEDVTFNHQLWFAAACSGLHRSPEIIKNVTQFLSVNLGQLETYSDGIIYHRSFLGSYKGYLSLSPFRFARKLYARVRQNAQRSSLYLKSVGYHAFNLHAFAIISNNLPDLSLYEIYDINRLFEATAPKSFEDNLQKQDYGLRYNPSGIELAFALKTFKGEEGDIEKWLKVQSKYTMNDHGFLLKGSKDSATAKARLYEASRLLQV